MSSHKARSITLSEAIALFETGTWTVIQGAVLRAHALRQNAELQFAELGEGNLNLGIAGRNIPYLSENLTFILRGNEAAPIVYIYGRVDAKRNDGKGGRKIVQRDLAIAIIRRDKAYRVAPRFKLKHNALRNRFTAAFA